MANDKQEKPTLARVRLWEDKTVTPKRKQTKPEVRSIQGDTYRAYKAARAAVSKRRTDRGQR